VANTEENFQLATEIRMIAGSLTLAASRIQNAIEALGAQNPSLNLQALKIAAEPVGYAAQKLGALQPPPAQE
jgi:hypothetical protein